MWAKARGGSTPLSRILCRPWQRFHPPWEGKALPRVSARGGGIALAGALGVGDDLLDEGRPELRRQVVAHALDHPQAGTGDGVGRCPAAGGPDEDVAADLQNAAERARKRTGYGTAASLYRQAADLTPGKDAQAARLRAAANMTLQAGRPEEAEALAARAGTLTDDPAELARLSRVRAVVEYERGNRRTAARMMVEHAAYAKPDDRAAMLRTSPSPRPSDLIPLSASRYGLTRSWRRREPKLPVIPAKRTFIELPVILASQAVIGANSSSCRTYEGLQGGTVRTDGPFDRRREELIWLPQLGFV